MRFLSVAIACSSAVVLAGLSTTKADRDGKATVHSLGQPPSSVVRFRTDKGRCSAFKISANALITAGHCVAAVNAIVVTPVDKGQFGQPVSATVGARHGTLDVALLCATVNGAQEAKLASSLPGEKSSILIGGFSQFVQGWSSTTTVANPKTDQNHFTVVPVHSPGVKDPRDPGHLLTLPCHGDSGSPAIQNGEVVGIAEKSPRTSDMPSGTCGSSPRYVAAASVRAWADQNKAVCGQ